MEVVAEKLFAFVMLLFTRETPPLPLDVFKFWFEFLLALADMVVELLRFVVALFW